MNSTDYKDLKETPEAVRSRRTRWGAMSPILLGCCRTTSTRLPDDRRRAHSAEAEGGCVNLQPTAGRTGAVRLLRFGEEGDLAVGLEHRESVADAEGRVRVTARESGEGGDQVGQVAHHAGGVVGVVGGRGSR